MDTMQKRLRLMLFGAFLLCALLVGFFTFNHIAGPAHASSTDYYAMGVQDGGDYCTAYKAGQPQKGVRRSIPFDQSDNYKRGWHDGAHSKGCE